MSTEAAGKVTNLDDMGLLREVDATTSHERLAITLLSKILRSRSPSKVDIDGFLYQIKNLERLGNSRGYIYGRLANATALMGEENQKRRVAEIKKIVDDAEAAAAAKPGASAAGEGGRRRRKTKSRARKTRKTRSTRRR